MWIKRYLLPFLRKNWLKCSLVLVPWAVFFLLIAPFHIPDEYSHYTFIQALAHGNYPYLRHVLDENCWSEEVRFFEAQYKMDNVTIVYSPRTSQPVPKGLSDTAHCSTQAQHPPLYYGAATIIYKLASFFGAHGYLRYNLVRLTSLIFYIGFLFFAQKLLSLFFSPKLSSWMMLLFAFQPMLIQLGTHVNPEVAVVALSTATLYYVCVFLQQKKISWKNVVLLLFLSLVCFYSKLTGIVMLPVVLATILFLSPNTWKERLSQAIFFVVSYAVCITPYLLWNYHLYGKPLENGLMYLVLYTELPQKISMTMKVSYLLTDYYQSFFQIAGDVARLDAPPFSEVRVLYSFTLLLFILLGIWTSLKHYKKSSSFKKQFIILLLQFFLTLGVYAYLGYDYMRLAWKGPLLQIRYTFIATLPVVIFFFTGFFKYIKENKVRLIKILFLLSVLHFNIFVLWSIIPRFYL